MRLLLSSLCLVFLCACGSDPGTEDVIDDVVEIDAAADAISDTTEPPEDTVEDMADHSVTTDDGNATDAGEEIDAVEVIEDVPYCSDCTVADVEPLSAYAERQTEYLNLCAENNGPGEGNSYGQVCRVATGQVVNTDKVDSAVEDLVLRDDCSDFRAAALVRMLYFNQQTDALDTDTYNLIKDTLIDYRYWMTEPGTDQMCYWSENHQILFHSAEYLAGRMFSEETFTNNGMTGAQHQAHAKPLVLKWLNLRGAVGFSEWHSNVYFNEDIPALVNLADFADDPEIRTKAMMVLDIIAFDMASNYYGGYFATTHGRTYEGELLNGLNDHTTEGGWMLNGLGMYEGDNNFSAVFLASSGNYFVPDVINEIAAAASAGEFEHRQRDSLDIADGPDWGLTYTEDDDIPTWAGFSAIAAPELINGTLAFVDKYDLWEGFLFGQLPDYLIDMVKQNMGTQDIVNLAEDADVVSRGIALQSIDTYVYRTSDYQIAAAQDYHPGYWGAQTLMWQATLDDKAFVVASLPTNVELGGDEVAVAGDWVGSWYPRATVYKNAGVFQYRADVIPDLLSGFFKAKTAHAYFKRSAFDEVKQRDGWVMGRKNEGYLALYSQAETAWSDENDYELTTGATDNTWLVQMGSASEFGTFEDFSIAVTTSSVSFSEDGSVTWSSPSVGEINVGWTGPFTVDGKEIDLGPYKRFDNPYADIEFGSRVTRIRYGDKTLELDFENCTRQTLVHPAQ